jgi:hypothetical protein
MPSETRVGGSHCLTTINDSLSKKPPLLEPLETESKDEQIKCAYCGELFDSSLKVCPECDAPVKTSEQLPTISVSDYVDHLVPRELDSSLDDEDNAIEPRKVIIFGREKSGKSNDAQIIIDELKRIYGTKEVGAVWFKAENFREAIKGKWPSKKVMVFVFEDITDAGLSDADAKELFRMRHLIEERTGQREGLCMCIFTVHSFYDMPRSFRTDYDSLVVLSLPMNDWDFRFIQSKITREGVKVLEDAEETGARGKAIVSVRRSLLAVTQFPRRAPKKHLFPSFLRRIHMPNVHLTRKKQISKPSKEKQSKRQSSWREDGFSKLFGEGLKTD